MTDYRTAVDSLLDIDDDCFIGCQATEGIDVGWHARKNHGYARSIPFEDAGNHQGDGKMTTSNKPYTRYGDYRSKYKDSTKNTIYKNEVIKSKPTDTSMENYMEDKWRSNKFELSEAYSEQIDIKNSQEQQKNSINLRHLASFCIPKYTDLSQKIQKKKNASVSKIRINPAILKKKKLLFQNEKTIVNSAKLKTDGLIPRLVFDGGHLSEYLLSSEIQDPKLLEFKKKQLGLLPDLGNSLPNVSSLNERPAYPVNIIHKPKTKLKSAIFKVQKISLTHRKHSESTTIVRSKPANRPSEFSLPPLSTNTDSGTRPQISQPSNFIVDKQALRSYFRLPHCHHLATLPNADTRCTTDRHTPACQPRSRPPKP